MRDTIDMAREAGIKHDINGVWCEVFELKAFEALVRADERNKQCEAFQQILSSVKAIARADEREACAQIAADYGPSRPIVSKNPSSQIVGRWEGEQAASAAIDAAIRARGDK